MININHESHFLWILFIFGLSLFLAFFYTMLNFGDVNRLFKGFKQSESILVIQIFVLFCIIVGFRPTEIGTDTSNYVTLFNAEEQGVDIYATAQVEPIFMGLTKVLSFFMPLEGYFIVISLLIFLPICFYFYKIHRTNMAVVTFFLFSLFTTYSFALNIIRNGLAIGMIFISLICYQSRQRILCILFLLLAFLFHSSALLWILVFYLVIFFPRVELKWFFVLWFVASLISLSNVINNSVIDKLSIFLPEFSSDKLAAYTEVIDYKSGFRVDFWLFSFIFVGGFFGYRKYIEGEFEKTVLKLFLVLNSIFILMFFLPYNDRFGALSYILIPSLAGFIYQNTSVITKLALNFFFLFLGIYSIFFQLISAYK